MSYLSSGEYVTMIGNGYDCARKDCRSEPAQRVILGSWDLQAYVCNKHIKWAVDLDLLTQQAGEKLGWHYGYPTKSGTLQAHPTQIVPTGEHVSRIDFTRDESNQIGSSWRPNEPIAQKSKWNRRK